MGIARGALEHAVGLYRRLLSAALRPIHGLEAEAHHLHDVERSGASGETPFIAVLGLLLFLVPIFALMLALALLAAHIVD